MLKYIEINAEGVDFLNYSKKYFIFVDCFLYSHTYPEITFIFLYQPILKLFSSLKTGMWGWNIYIVMKDMNSTSQEFISLKIMHVRMQQHKRDYD